MKKILLLVLLASLVVPMIGLAAQGPVECCKMGSRTVEIGTESFSNKQTVGPTGTLCELPNFIGVPNVAPDKPTEKWGLVCALNTLNVVINWIFLFLVVIAVLLTVLGALDLMLAAGDTAKVSAGRNKIMYAAIGLLVALVARAVPSLVKAILGY